MSSWKGESVKLNDVSLLDVLNALPEHILILDGRGTLVAANASWRHALRSQRPGHGESVGQPYQAVFPVSHGVAGEVRDRLHAGIADVLSGNLPRFDSEYCLRPALGTNWFELSAVPLRDGRPGGVVTQRDITARKALEADLIERANHDDLTGLANRRFFLLEGAHMLALARRQGWQAGLVYLDLDDFKAINDQLGHATGDKALSLVSSHLLRHTRESDLLARVGGDEFVLLLAKASPDEVARVVRILRRSLATPLPIDGQAFSLQGSFGVAHHPRDGATLDALLAHADRAMYREKVLRRLQRQLCTA